jgi:6-pyruvoyltetrahydropterin/6-carboxytetrahydropterin synthase
VELLFESNFLDNGQMVYDFGLMKQNMKTIIDSFDHAIAIWSKDDESYIKDMQKHSDRWVLLPVSPSCEQFSRVIFLLIEKLLDLTTTQNGERDVKLRSVVVHETQTGYAECFYEDAHSKNMGNIELDEIVFSKAIADEWQDSELFEKIKNNERFINPKSV